MTEKPKAENPKAEQPQKKKYNVNLPKTPFPMKASLAQREPERLKQWKTAAVEEKVAQKQKTSQERFILHDGPPYANGHIHIGHALNKTLKDMIVKYKTMTGHNARYVPGWDCHGLPIEHACLKEMGKRKDDVERVSFRKQARKYAEKFIKIQKEEFQRLGIFAEWDNPYLTMNFNYQTSIVKAFWEIYEKGFIEQRLKPVPWCFDCETALADAELEYQDKVSKSIYITFKSTEDENTHYIVWTTTPWTLPANVGLAFHPGLDYVTVQQGDKKFIFASDLKHKIAELLEIPALETSMILKTQKGSEFEGKEAKHPFMERTSKIIMADYVSATDGTGIVHIAPGHGEDDYQYGNLKNGLEILSPVDEKGRFTQEFPFAHGEHVFKSNDKIIEHLKELSALIRQEEHGHSYPHCWRCKKPILFRATAQWFMKVDHENLRSRISKAIANDIEFIPDWGKNRIGTMIETRPDWCLSRQRLWGVPIPLPVHKETGEVHLTEDFKTKVVEFFEREGADAWFRRPIEDFFPNDPELASKLKLQDDILDVWFDSGVSHQAVLESGHELGFPTELYLEGSDQHRGWFQTSLISAIALRDQSPFKQVLTHGFVVDGQGKKMSKSTGNVVSPQDVMKKYGADILRLWVSSCDTETDIRMSEEVLQRSAEAYRKMRNTFRYMLGNIGDFSPAEHRVPFEQMESVDQWILSRLHQLSKEVLPCYEKFNFHSIYRHIYDFCISDLSSFYLDSLKDRLYCNEPSDAARRSSQSALFIISKALCQWLAPILVFTTEEVWQSFDFGPEESVHLSEWDNELWAHYSEESLKLWNAIRSIREEADSLIEKMREAKEVGSSLDCQVHLNSDEDELSRFLATNKELIQLGLIVSGVTLEKSPNAQAYEIEWVGKENKALKQKLWLAVTKASGEKCARCWNYKPEVGSLNDPTLCSRCHKAEEAHGAATSS